MKLENIKIDDFQMGFDEENNLTYLDLPTIQAVSIDRIKQAKEEIEQNAYPIVHGVNNHDMGMTLNGIFQVLDKLIESEE